MFFSIAISSLQIAKILGVAPPDPRLKSTLYHSHTINVTDVWPPCRSGLELPLTVNRLLLDNSNSFQLERFLCFREYLTLLIIAMPLSTRIITT